jgi:IPT/TIG domain
MANGLQLPLQATSQGPGDAFTITSNVEIQDNQTIAAISGINTGPLKLLLLGGMKPPVPIGVLGDSSKNMGIGVQGNSSGNIGVQGNDSGKGAGVEGTSAQGTGIIGRGPTAGYFEGDVKVTGTLVAQVDLLVGSTRFTELELQVQQLQTEVQQLQMQLQQLQTKFSEHTHTYTRPQYDTLSNIASVVGNPGGGGFGPYLVSLISPEENTQRQGNYLMTEPTSPANVAPVVSGIQPNSGSFAGGTKVTVAGTGFTGVTGVTFDGNAAANVTPDQSNPDTQLTADSPPGTGTVDVIVTTPDGSSPTSRADQFTYQ